MKQIRRGVFETNSSSTHSLTMCDLSDFEKWQSGELIWRCWCEDFITIEDYNKEYEKVKNEYPDEEEYRGDNGYMTYEDFDDYYDYETFRQTFTNKDGVSTVAFGYYGYSG